jgi:hypothetical protein
MFQEMLDRNNEKVQIPQTRAKKNDLSSYLRYANKDLKLVYKA